MKQIITSILFASGLSMSIGCFAMENKAPFHAQKLPFEEDYNLPLGVNKKNLNIEALLKYKTINKAAELGNPDALQQLLNTKPDSINTRNSLGETPFMRLIVGFMAFNGRVERMHDGTDPLLVRYEARSRENYKKAAAILISEGTDLDIPNNEGKKWSDIADANAVALIVGAAKMIQVALAALKQDLLQTNK